MKCQKCGVETGNMDYCSKCWAEQRTVSVKAPSICPQCKCYVGDAPFCGKCGLSTEEARQSVGPQPTGNAADAKQMRSVGIACACIIVTCLAIVLIARSGTTSRSIGSAARTATSTTMARTTTTEATTVDPFEVEVRRVLNVAEDDVWRVTYMLKTYLQLKEFPQDAVVSKDGELIVSASFEVDGFPVVVTFLEDDENGLYVNIEIDGMPLFDADGGVINSLYEMQEARKARIYKESCKSIKYSDLARNPSKYKGESLKIRGKVVQVIEDGSDITLRVAVTNKGYGHWDDVILVGLEMFAWEDGILDNDIITIWGVCQGSYTYEAVLGNKITVPAMTAEYFSIE